MFIILINLHKNNQETCCYYFIKINQKIYEKRTIFIETKKV